MVLSTVIYDSCCADKVGSIKKHARRSCLSVSIREVIMHREFWFLLLFFVLSGCSRTGPDLINRNPDLPQQEHGISQAPYSSVTEQSVRVDSAVTAYSMASLEERLNTRYESQVASCAGNTPVFHCSGILIRRAVFNADYDFWTPSAGAARLGSLTFSYIREGAYSNSSDVTSGFILMPPDDAKIAGKTQVNARCIYPFIANTQGNNRPMHGCGFVGATDPNPPPADLSSCATLAVPAITPAAWIKNFTTYGSDILNQCSLSVTAPAQFNTSLSVRSSFPSLTRIHNNEILFELWDSSTPEKLPIEAFFYNASHEGALVNAQALKHAYKVKTNIELPIVRLNFTTGAKHFEARAFDQEDGWTVAQRLNARHTDTTRACAGAQAAVYCSGILVRATEYSPAFHAWDPNPNSRPVDAVSFSYLRSDISTLATFNDKGQGFIFRELNYAPTAGLQPVKALCIYIADADTWDRADQGCGINSTMAGSQRCAAQTPSVNSVETLKAHFQSVPASPTWQRLHHQCSLAINAGSLMLAIEGRRSIVNGNESPFYRYNEIMLAAWPTNVPANLPIDSFYYVAGNADGLSQAKEIQKDFWRSANGMIKPVIRMDLKAAANQVFSYQVADQAY